MDDENPQPPAPPVPPVAPQFPPPVVPEVAPPATVYPPPVPVPPARPGRTAALVIGIVVGAIVVIGGLGAAIFFVAQSAISSLDSAAPDASGPDTPSTDGSGPAPITLRPLIEGDPSDPVAVEPLECASACFSPGVLSLAVPARDSVQQLGLPVVESPLGIDSSSPDTEYTNTSRTWVSGEGEPEECFFTYLSVPLAATLGERPASSTDPIDFLSYANTDDQYSYLTMSSRLFGDSASAEAHMATVDGLVPGCLDYDIGTGQDFWTADVSPLPALELPASVAATGWVEDGPFGRYYVVDLQRGNLVVRSMLGTDGAVTEEDFRSFIEEYAVQIAGLEQVN